MKLDKAYSESKIVAYGRYVLAREEEKEKTSSLP